MNYNFSQLVYAWAAFYAASALLFLLGRKRLSRIVLGAGLLLNIIFLIQRGWLAGVFIPNGMFEGVFLMPAVMAGILFAMGIPAGDGEDAEYLSGTIPLTLFAMMALVYPRGIIPPTPNKLSIWANLFFLTEAAGHSCFYLGG